MTVREALWCQRSLALTRPYTIAYRTIATVELFFVRLTDDAGNTGLGCASPARAVTGETPQACGKALAHGSFMLQGQDSRHLGRLSAMVRRQLDAAPAARAALDMALHDLFAQQLRVPLVDLLGRCHQALPTSITIGIKPVDATLDEAREYLGRGFTHLKVKLGRNLEEDLERLHRLRELCGDGVCMRVDANQGFDDQETRRLFAAAASLQLDLVEQPLPMAAVEGMRALPASSRQLLAADESLRSPQDALELAAPPPACGIFNIKLMKCGGITPALEIAAMAQAGGIDLMWGCMDESVISISAALHTAYACPGTRYLDLDGSLDLAEDGGRGGFTVEGGRLHLQHGPGLGVQADPGLF